MLGINNEPLGDILKQYPYSINKILLHQYKSDRGVWWIHTNKGLKILKKFPRSENRLKFILEAISHLKSKGINIPKIHKTINKELYVNYEGTCYILMEAIAGYIPVNIDEKGLKTVITTMGNFHRASIGFKPSNQWDISNWLGECPNNYINEYNALKKYYVKTNNKAVHSTFEETTMKEISYFLKRIKDVQTELSNSKHANWVKKVSKNGGLVHLDFSLRNLIITPSNKIYVLDFDDLSIGLPMMDIRILFYEIINNLKPFTKKNLESMIKWYQRANPLTEDEWDVVKINMLFPYKFTEIIRYFSDKTVNWTHEMYLEELKKSITGEILMKHNLKEFDHIIKKLF